MKEAVKKLKRRVKEMRGHITALAVLVDDHREILRVLVADYNSRKGDDGAMNQARRKNEEADEAAS